MVKTIRKFHSHEEMRLAHLQGWQKLTLDEINHHTWQLVVDYRKMHDIRPYEPRLQRTVTNFRRT
ncbi:MAG: hypothetical protein V4733_05585 [Verrucomicrobiota bacterium]